MTLCDEAHARLRAWQRTAACLECCRDALLTRACLSCFPCSLSHSTAACATNTHAQLQPPCGRRPHPLLPLAPPQQPPRLLRLENLLQPLLCSLLCALLCSRPSCARGVAAPAAPAEGPAVAPAAAASCSSQRRCSSGSIERGTSALPRMNCALKGAAGEGSAAVGGSRGAAATTAAAASIQQQHQFSSSSIDSSISSAAAAGAGARLTIRLRCSATHSGSAA